ncbi:MAG: ice-binding family protein, partial [Lentisphaerota bacterium]
ANKTITANFAINTVNTYTVTFVEGANGTITGTKVQNVTQGGSTTAVTAVPLTGYHFVNWTGSLTSTANPLTVSNVTANKTITANFAINTVNTYTVTFVEGANGTITGTKVQNVAQGGSTTEVTAVPSTGYHFVNWTGSLTSTANPLTVSNVTANKTITANFAINTYTVTFDLAGKGTRIGGGLVSQTVNHGATATAPTVSANIGWTFTGWDKPLSNIIGNTTITAQYSVVPTYTVTFVEGANGTITGTKVQTVFQGGSTTAVTAAPSTGYHFVNWTGGLSSTANPLTVTNVMADMTITANFAINIYTVTFDLAGYSTRTGGGALIQAVTHGSAAAAPTVLTNAGCNFTGWSRAFSNITADTRVIAQYYFSICTVTFVEGANGTITGTKVQTVNNGASTAAVTAVPSNGYHFVNWTGSFSGTANPLIIPNVTIPMTITANFAMNDIQIGTDVSSLDVNEASTATFQVKLMSQPVVNKTVSVSRTSGNTSITITGGSSLIFTPENWNTYQTVTVAAAHDADVANGTATITCASTNSNNQTVTVTEIDDDTTLTVTSGGNGTVSPSGAKTVVESAATSITATANTGYHFVNWTATSGIPNFGNASSASTTVAISEPTTICANFGINDVQISTNASAINVNEGSTATFQIKLSAQTAASKTVSVTKTGGDASITVNSGASLTFTTANWNTYQTVTIAAAHDADTVNGTATITCASAGMTEQTVTVTEIDDDTTLTLTNSGNGTTAPSGIVIVAKSAATAINASASTGYHLAAWTVTSGAATFGNASSASTTVAISDPATIQAAFAINTFALTASLVGEGFITPSETVDYGTGKTFTIYPYANYHLANVLVDGVSVGAVPSHTFLDVRASHTIKAVFAVNETGPIQMNMTSGFAVLAGTAINNTGNTVIDGDIGLSPGSAVTGFPPGTYTGANHVGDPTAVQAKFDLSNAFGAAAARTQGVITISGGELGGRILVPGLYKSGTGTLAITSADLTLDGAGDVNAVWIFQMPASGLTVSAGRRIVLLNGANACNIFWQVGASATIGTNAVFHGTVMADQSITLANGAALNGRALARNGQVTLNNNTLTIPPAITITASAGSNGSITPSGIVEVHDGSQTFTITPEPGCHVVDVLVDGVSVGAVTSYAFTYVTISHLISARFAVDADTTLTVVSDGNGTITPSGAVVVTKSVATEILASANTGYHFVNWTLTSGVASIGNTDSA